MKIQRDSYLQKLISLEKNGRVKIVTGIRRCGKSFLLKDIYIPSLMNRGQPSDHILYIALDDLNNRRLLNPLTLDTYIRNQIQDTEPYTIILDEIQKVYRIKDPIFTEGKIVRAGNHEEDAIGFTEVVLGFLHIGYSNPGLPVLAT